MALAAEVELLGLPGPLFFEVVLLVVELAEAVSDETDFFGLPRFFFVAVGADSVFFGLPGPLFLLVLLAVLPAVDFFGLPGPLFDCVVELSTADTIAAADAVIVDCLSSFMPAFNCLTVSLRREV